MVYMLYIGLYVTHLLKISRIAHLSENEMTIVKKKQMTICVVQIVKKYHYLKGVC